MLISERKRGTCTFEGKNNRTKGYILMLLYLRRDEYLSVQEMSEYLISEQLSFPYIANRIRLWHTWGYIGKRLRKSDNYPPPYEYLILSKGLSLLKTFQDMKPRKFRSLELRVRQCIANVEEQKHLQEWASLVTRKDWHRKIADNLKGLGRPTGVRSRAVADIDDVVFHMSKGE
jgi:hypothetical protein